MASFLIKADGRTHLAAHLVDDAGRPRCKAQINRATWQLQSLAPAGMVICGNCRRLLARRQPETNTNQSDDVA